MSLSLRKIFLRFAASPWNNRQYVPGRMQAWGYQGLAKWLFKNNAIALVIYAATINTPTYQYTCGARFLARLNIWGKASIEGWGWVGVFRGFLSVTRLKFSRLFEDILQSSTWSQIRICLLYLEFTSGLRAIMSFILSLKRDISPISG